MDETPPAAEPVIDVAIGGRTYSLKPSFGAIRNIERGLDQPLGALHERMQARLYGAAEVTAILYHAAVAAEGASAVPPFEALGAAVVREGVDNCAYAALEVVHAALVGYAKFAAEREADAEPAPGAEAEGEETDPPTPPGARTSGGGSKASPSPSESSPASSSG